MVDRLSQQVIQCKWCGTETSMLGTKMCDGCYELRSRIRRQPELAERMLLEEKKERKDG